MESSCSRKWKTYWKKIQSNPNSGKYDTSRGVSVVLANALLGDPVCVCSYVYLCWIQHMWKGEEKWEKMDACIILWTYIMPWILLEHFCKNCCTPFVLRKTLIHVHWKKNIWLESNSKGLLYPVSVLCALFFFTGYLCETGACTDGREWNHLQGIINYCNILWFENEKKFTSEWCTTLP